MYGVPQINVPHLCGYFGGAVGSIISGFTELYKSGFSFEFETLLSQSYKWLLIYSREKAKEVGAKKYSASIVLQQCQNRICFQRKDSGILCESSVQF